ncbi:MAG: hypothetical protein J6A77_02875 [Lachnospiraceae bacterium]|nr:hypothetical protein [Lachnospiraceae bacterium]
MNQEEIAAYIIREYAPQNLKVKAIKYYRDMTGVDLAEAKLAVEKIFEEYYSNGMAGTAGMGLEDTSGSGCSTAVQTDLVERRKKEAEEYIRRNFTADTVILAIKYYRDVTGVGLAEAKLAVEQILVPEKGKKSSQTRGRQKSVSADVAVNTGSRNSEVRKSFPGSLGTVLCAAILIFGLCWLVGAAVITFWLPQKKEVELTKEVNEISAEKKEKLLERGNTEFLTDGNYVAEIWWYDADGSKKLYVFLPASGEGRGLGILSEQDDFGYAGKICEGLDIYYSGETAEDMVEARDGSTYEVMVVDAENVTAVHGVPSWRLANEIGQYASELRAMGIAMAVIGAAFFCLGFFGLRSARRG